MGKKSRRLRANKRVKKQEPKYDLFNNPMVASATRNMTPEQIETLRLMGHNMYATMDIDEKGNINQTIDNSLRYICDSIRSGLHISYLLEEEKNLLKSEYGDEWYQKFGYTEEDLTGIKTYGVYGKNQDLYNTE